MPSGVYPRTEEGRRNMSLAAKGKKLKPETIEKISSANRGKKRSEEFCKQMSEARKGAGNPMYGKKLKPKHIEAIRNAKKGFVWTNEMRTNLSQRLKEYHKRNPRTEETKDKISCGVKKAYNEGKVIKSKDILKTLEIKIKYKQGHSQTEETKKRISETLMGHSVSEISKQKMSENHKGLPGYWTGKTFETEHKQKLSDAKSGDKSPTWSGGISFEPYCPKFNKAFKQRVRDFFKGVCVLCGKTTEENGKQMFVHHVNYDKKTCCNSSPQLFVILCNNCHPKTNFNRQYWEEYFTKLIYEMYDGRCYLPKY